MKLSWSTILMLVGLACVQLGCHAGQSAPLRSRSVARPPVVPPAPGMVGASTPNTSNGESSSPVVATNPAAVTPGVAAPGEDLAAARGVLRLPGAVVALGVGGLAFL